MQIIQYENMSFIYFVLVLTIASTESPAATVDSETITLNSGTLQTFEILPVSNTAQNRYWPFYALKKLLVLHCYHMNKRNKNYHEWHYVQLCPCF